MKGVLLAALVLLAGAACAADLQVLKPVYVMVQDDGEVFLGTVGPGQTVFVEADALVETGGIHGIGGRWDRLEVVDVPGGWTAEDSFLYEQPLKARITVAKEAPDGEYEVLVRSVDIENKEGLGEVNLKLIVNVSREVFGMEVLPSEKETGATQPATYTVMIENKGVASDAFEISAKGLPAWDYKKAVFVPYGTCKSVQYDLVGAEDGEYDVTVAVRSFSSDRIEGEERVHLSVKTTLVSDYKATNNGLLLFPIFEQAAYSIMGLLANLF
ncbi:hypothetical protein DRN67_04135 [Candidatus Micrarchaeota archaeon]|nr:MAG: hypothetical protein DRN67_04135 [Candidatus Micrarchaeota archaeon]